MTSFIAIVVVLILVLQIVSIVIIRSELSGITPDEEAELKKRLKDAENKLRGISQP